MKDNFIDELIHTPKVYGVKVSPDRKWVVWMWGNVGPTTDLYIASLDVIHSPRKITDFGQKTRAISWSLDSKHILVGHDYDGDERFVLYSVDILTGEVLRLTDEHPDYFIRGGVMGYDKKHVFYGANYDFENNIEIESTFLYRHNLESGEKKRLSSHKKACYLEFDLNRQGTHIIFSRNDIDPEGQQIWMVDVNGDEEKEILNYGDKTKIFASWHQNGVDIVFLVELNNYRKVGIYNIISQETKWIINDVTRNIESAHIPYGTDSVLVLEIKNAVETFSLIDIETLKETKFPDLKIQLAYAQVSEDIWISKLYSSTQPGDLIIHDIKKDLILRKVTDVFAQVPYLESDLVQAESYFWKSDDGLDIQGWLYKTKLKAKGTILVVHGGPTAHSQDGFDMDIQYFVSQGFNVLDPNYRGSTGFGVVFQEEIKKHGWGGMEQVDILAGIKSLINNRIAEPYKIGVTGTSYGGYSAWYAITHFDPQFVSAAAPICGMTDLVVDYETTRPDLRGYSEEMMGGTPSDIPLKYHKASPIHFVQNIKGDLMIIQGAKDPNITLDNVKGVEAVLIRHGIKYKKLIFDDEGHGISKPKNQAMMLKKMVDFFSTAFEK